MLSAIRRIPTSPDDRYMLSDGNSIPCIGYGTWRVKDREDGARVCEEAVRAGYRHFDTAYLYGSEGSVGEAVRTSGLARSDFFVTTKVWKDDLSVEGARRELGVSLERLRRPPSHPLAPPFGGGPQLAARDHGNLERLSGVQSGRTRQVDRGRELPPAPLRRA